MQPRQGSPFHELGPRRGAALHLNFAAGFFVDSTSQYQAPRVAGGPSLKPEVFLGYKLAKVLRFMS